MSFTTIQCYACPPPISTSFLDRFAPNTEADRLGPQVSTPDPALPRFDSYPTRTTGLKHAPNPKKLRRPPAAAAIAAVRHLRRTARLLAPADDSDEQPGDPAPSASLSAGDIPRPTARAGAPAAASSSSENSLEDLFDFFLQPRKTAEIHDHRDRAPPRRDRNKFGKREKWPPLTLSDLPPAGGGREASTAVSVEGDGCGGGDPSRAAAAAAVATARRRSWRQEGQAPGPRQDR